MDQSLIDRTEHFIEELRMSGCRGLEPWVTELAPRLGTRVVAIRALEVAATHVASLWLDSAGGHEMQVAIRDCFLEEMLALVAVFERTYPVAERPTLRKLIEPFEHDLSDEECSGAVVATLIATMVLRQLHAPKVVPSQNFVPRSSNVHPEFFARCVNALGWVPFDANEHSSLKDLFARINECQSIRQLPATSSKSLAS